MGARFEGHIDRRSLGPFAGFTQSPYFRMGRASLMVIARADDFTVFDDDTADSRVRCRIAQGGLRQVQGFFHILCRFQCIPSLLFRLASETKKGYGRKIPIAF